MAEKTKAELLEIIDILEKQNARQRDKIENTLYVSVECGERSFIIAKKQVGSNTKYSSVATCRNRTQTESILKLLNGEQK